MDRCGTLHFKHGIHLGVDTVGMVSKFADGTKIGRVVDGLGTNPGL